MTQTLLLDTESGYTSVLDEIDAGLVVRRKINSYNDADAAVWELLRAAKDTLPRAVGMDSFTTLADRSIEEIKFPMSKTQNAGAVWLEVGQKDGFTASQPEWGKLSSALFRFCWNMETFSNENEIPFFLTCGEELREDGPRGAKMFGPDVSPKVRGFILHYADTIGRLGILPGPGKMKDLDGKEKDFPAGTRCLRLAPNADFHAKCRVRRSRWESGKFLDVLPNPTIPRLAENAGLMPNRVLIYGAAGTGKTTFICSQKPKKEENQ